MTNKKYSIKNKVINNKNNESKNEDIDGLELKYAERISRMLLVIGTFSLLGIFFNKLLSVLYNSFNILYINCKIPIGGEHILSTILLSDIALIFLASLLYCYSELYTLATYNRNEDKIKYQLKADNYFKKLLGILIICVILTVVALLIIITIFTDLRTFQRFGIILFFLIFVILDRKNLINYLREFVLNFKLGISTLLFISMFWIFLTFLFFTLGSLHIGDKQKSYAIFKFDTQNVLNLDIHFQNKLPKEIIIGSDKPNSTTIKIPEEYFFKYFVEATKENFNESKVSTPTTNQFLYKQSFYEYHYRLNIDKLLQQGKNTIIVNFKIDGELNSKKSYKLVNQIEYINGKYNIFKQDMNISLD